MSKRINVLLSDDTVQVLDRVAERGKRSRFIGEAIHYYVASLGRRNLREKLKKAAMANAERDLQITREWFDLDEQSWSRTPSRKSEK